MHRSKWSLPLLILIIATIATDIAHGMLHEHIQALKQDTRDLFYHGFDNYMLHAFPEDELKPLSCVPQTRNAENPADIGLNDVLGNYSLTLIDSLSTLAILASDQNVSDGMDALADFQEGIKDIVELYGDGTRDAKGKSNCGRRACGFDLDSKVQVFETNIRGVGGLLSAHLFAIGELPITGYKPDWTALSPDRSNVTGESRGIRWASSSPFVYDGHLLRLAYDLALRLLPAFDTATGLPYPRVNLRHGIPFYQISEDGVCRPDGTSTDPRDITETCAAGAGSLILEFTTLSRLSGDDRFERLAKRAFWAVWERRSSIGLVGNGIDAESGVWTSPPLAGIGAGIDSFFEYAVKSHILLQGLPYDPDHEDQDAPQAFWHVWQNAHAAVRRHLYRGPRTEKYPFYGQGDLASGAPRYGWIDNLSAYWPGLLTLAGELDEAIESHLLFSALWTHYSALPERWHAVNAWIDPNFRHWAGRPEFIESTWYLYRATNDPWYLHVGEMAIRDIKRRCWTSCGWADLGDVVTGEMRDRMESFFLGETAKYLFLLFDKHHPLNHMDDAVVFTTEGHPLKIPKKYRSHHSSAAAAAAAAAAGHQAKQHSAISQPSAPFNLQCPAPAPPLPLTISNTANRPNFFHAAAMTNLHLVPVHPARPSPLLAHSSHHAGVSYSDVRSPTNYTWYPWPLSHQLIPAQGFSETLPNPLISTLTFPNLAPPTSPGMGRGSSLSQEGSTKQQQAAAKLNKNLMPLSALQKTLDGILINSLSNVRLNMVQETRSLLLPDEAGVLVEQDLGVEYRVHGIGNWALGKDEKVWIGEGAMKGLSLEGSSGEEDAPLRRVKDREWVDLVIDVVPETNREDTHADFDSDLDEGGDGDIWDELKGMLSGIFGTDGIESLVQGLGASLDFAGMTANHLQEGGIVGSGGKGRSGESNKKLTRALISAVLPTGPGAAPLPTLIDSHQETLSTAMLGNINNKSPSMLPFRSIFYLDSTLCSHRLPFHIAKDYNILVIKRGQCSFSEKLANIPTFPPVQSSLQLVIVVDLPWTDEEEKRGNAVELVRPLLDKVQKSPNGVERRTSIAMVMVDGSETTRKLLMRVASMSGRVEEDVLIEYQNSPQWAEGGIGVKRKYWFESLGVVVGNLFMA